MEELKLPFFFPYQGEITVHKSFCPIKLFLLDWARHSSLVFTANGKEAAVLIPTALQKTKQTTSKTPKQAKHPPEKTEKP